MLAANAHYEHRETGTVKCSVCWSVDIVKTKTNEYIDDEKVFERDLELMDETEPIQCDDCLEQNDAYDELGTEPG